MGEQWTRWGEYGGHFCTHCQHLRLTQREALPSLWASPSSGGCWGFTLPRTLKHWSPWHGCAQANNTKSLRTSLTPCKDHWSPNLFSVCFVLSLSGRKLGSWLWRLLPFRIYILPAQLPSLPSAEVHGFWLFISSHYLIQNVFEFPLTLLVQCCRYLEECSLTSIYCKIFLSRIPFLFSRWALW